jgi:hypothetical protein
MRKYLAIIFVVAPLLLASPQGARAVDWFPLVPCGLNNQPKGATRMDTLPDGTQVPHDYTQPCNQCLLIELGKNVIDMTFFAIVPTVGTLLFMIAGFIILINAHSGKGDGVARGRKIMEDTAIGIAIILGAWLITNFILKSIATDEVANTPWYQIQCTIGTLEDIVVATVPSASPSGTPKPPGSTTPPAGGPVQCLQSGLNLCEGDAGSVGCANSSCSQYLASIQKYANGAATENVLKAFMEVESSCNIKAATGTSYGLMQMTPPIPQMYASRCGVSASAVNGSWLTNPVNADKSICIAAEWIKALAASKCGPSIRNMYAGYNGGVAGACSASTACAGDTSCSGEPVKRWECLYDDPAKTQCNGGNNIMAGYNQTRQGARRIQYCAVNPGF